jgi:hypothetical protein
VAVALRELCGHDEIAVDGVDTLCAAALLGRLLAGPPPIDAMQLAAADRDALLAALHRQCWGDRIVATLTCAACAHPFDLSFQLSDVQRHLAAREPVDGASFRAPRAEDELAAAAQAESPVRAVERLAEACGAGPADIEAASATLSAAAPIVDLDLSARCAECGHEQAAGFDLQSFMLQRLLNERAALLAEIHLLAAAYGWSLPDILSLARGTRRALAEMLGKARRS